MAEDKSVEEEPGEPDEKEPEKKNGRKPGAPHLLVRLLLGISGLLLIIGFFLPLLNLASEAHPTVNGLELVTSNDTVILAVVGADTQRWLLLLIPGFGIALTGVAVSGFRHSGLIAAMLGILIVASGLVGVIVFFFQRTEVGLWLILLGAFLAVATGVLAFLRSRDKKDADKKDADKDAEKLADAGD